MAEREIAVGSQAPTFRLPSAQGGLVDLASYRGHCHVIIWFSKGFGCPFCRQQKSRLVRGYAKFQALNAELLEVTRTPLARARLYARQFPLAFPYLCDEENEARRAYGLAARPYALTAYVGRMLGSLWRPKAFPEDYGPSSRWGTLPGIRPSPRELYQVMSDEDTGFFIVDRLGIVRFADRGPNRADGGRGTMREPPPNDGIITTLETCERVLR